MLRAEALSSVVLKSTAASNNPQGRGKCITHYQLLLVVGFLFVSLPALKTHKTGREQLPEAQLPEVLGMGRKLCAGTRRSPRAAHAVASSLEFIFRFFWIKMNDTTTDSEGGAV